MAGDNDMKIGDLVAIRPAVAPPQLYGIGIITKIVGMRCYVQWSELPDKPPGGCAPYGLEIISASR